MTDISRLKQMQSRWSQGSDIIESPSVILTGDGVECVDENRIYVWIVIDDISDAIIGVHVSKQSAMVERMELKQECRLEQWELVDRSHEGRP